MKREQTTAQLRRLCRRAVSRVTSASGAAVSLMSTSGPSGIVAASDDRTLQIADLQFSLGEGPCWDVFDQNHVVLVDDLGSGSGDRWVAWTAAASNHGVRAVLAFPLQVGPTQLGVLDIYRAAAGVLGAEVLAEALALADNATQILLDGQERAGEGATPTGIDAALEAGLAIYQAQGMVMIQLGVPLADAMSRLRAYAYAKDRSLSEVARDIVARTLTLERDDR